MGEPVRGKKCDGIMGIVEEGKHAMEELEGSVRDAALIAGAQKIEHYEIASYGTLAYFAELLGNEKAKDLLGQTLDEEKAADEKLSTIAKSSVNREALMGAGTEEDEEEYERRPIRHSSRRSGGRALAHDRSRGGVRGNAGPPSLSLMGAHWVHGVHWVEKVRRFIEPIDPAKPVEPLEPFQATGPL
jgi:Domain of unknown function (DUF892)